MTLTVQQCAQQLGVHSHTIRKLIWRGDLPAEKIPKGREQWTYVVSAEDWQRFIAERAEGPIEAPHKREPVRQSPHYAYFLPEDPDDRAVMQATLMWKALNGDTAAREALRQAPYWLHYWMAADGPRGPI